MLNGDMMALQRDFEDPPAHTREPSMMRAKTSGCAAAIPESFDKTHEGASEAIVQQHV